jgi:Uma2 family endonuclease
MTALVGSNPKPMTASFISGTGSGQTAMGATMFDTTFSAEDTLPEGQAPPFYNPSTLTHLRSSYSMRTMQPLRTSKASGSRSKPASVPANDGLPESGERLKPWNPGPVSNEPEMEGVFHVLTFFYLMSSLRWYWREKKNWFAIGNLSVFYPEYSRRAGRVVRKKLSFRGPDFFVALNVDPNLPRNSWVVEREGKYPDIIVEILSKSTAKKDRGEKKEIYERTFKTHEYFLFDPETKRIEGFRLVNERYAPIAPNAVGHLWSERLELFFGLHEEHLRFFSPNGTLVPLPDEAATQAILEREKTRIASRKLAAKNESLLLEKSRLTAEKERLAAKLRALGVDPDDL